MGQGYASWPLDTHPRASSHPVLSIMAWFLTTQIGCTAHLVTLGVLCCGRVSVDPFPVGALPCPDPPTGTTPLVDVSHFIAKRQQKNHFLFPPCGRNHVEEESRETVGEAKQTVPPAPT